MTTSLLCSKLFKRYCLGTLWALFASTEHNTWVLLVTTSAMVTVNLHLNGCFQSNSLLWHKARFTQMILSSSTFGMWLDGRLTSWVRGNHEILAYQHNPISFSHHCLMSVTNKLMQFWRQKMVSQCQCQFYFCSTFKSNKVVQSAWQAQNKKPDGTKTELKLKANVKKWVFRRD